MQKNAYVIDAYSHDSYHEVINQGYLMMISELYDHVTYIAEKTSCKNLKDLMTKCNFDYSNVTFCEKKISRPKFKWAGLNYLLWLIKVSFLNYIYYIKSPSETDVFYNNNLYFGCWLVKHFSFWKKNLIFDMCHSEMEMIDPQKRNTSVLKLLGKFFDYSFKKKVLPSKISFLLLSPKMVKYFNSWIKVENQKNIKWIDHCYIRPQNNYTGVDIKDCHLLKIGIPGAISESRGLTQLQEILPLLKEGNVKLYATSFVSGIEDSSKFESLNKTGKLLPFSEYNNYVRQMDALILFYEAGSYQLTASGAILEAIWNQKPIFALKNAYFDYLFDKFGPIGQLFDNVESLTLFLNSMTLDSVAKFQKNLKNARDYLLPFNTKTQLQEICSNV